MQSIRKILRYGCSVFYGNLRPKKKKTHKMTECLIFWGLDDATSSIGNPQASFHCQTQN